MIVIEMVHCSVFWRNTFALKGDISKTQSPSEIVLNRKLNFNAYCKVEFGQYVQTHEDHSNDMQSRTLGAIAIRPSNDVGAFYFVSLLTGCRINHCAWTQLPAPESVIAQVHSLAHRAKTKKKLTFTNADNEDYDTLYAELERDDSHPI